MTRNKNVRLPGAAVPLPLPVTVGGTGGQFPWMTEEMGRLLLIYVVPLVALLLALIWWLQNRRSPSPEDKGTRPVSPLPPRGPYLESIGPGEPRRLYPDPQGSVIGRAPGGEGIDLLIDKQFPNWETVSRRHARLYRRGEKWAVKDLGSLNGTYVNGRRTGHNLLHDGWQVDIGGVQFVFRTGDGRHKDEMS